VLTFIITSIFHVLNQLTSWNLTSIFSCVNDEQQEYVAAASQKPTKGAPAKQEAAKATEAPKEAPKAAAPAKDTKKPEQKEQKEAQPKKEQQQDGKQEKKQPEKKKQDGQGKGQGQGQGQGKGQGQGQGKGQKGAAVKKAEGPVDVSRLDLRVGKILYVFLLFESLLVDDFCLVMLRSILKQMHCMLRRWMLVKRNQDKL
jgi:cobalamin biosynthesis Mg chelatase CobN